MNLNVDRLPLVNAIDDNARIVFADKGKNQVTSSIKYSDLKTDISGDVDVSAYLPLAGGIMTGTIDASGITANGDGTGGKVLKYGDLLVQMGEYGLDDFTITTDNGGFAERYFYLDNVQIVISHNASASITVDTNGTSITGSIGFFGSTPISKQNTGSQTPATFAANSSGISDDTATWGGYTVGDIVAILQAYNLIT